MKQYVDAFLKIFQGREDMFAVQLDTGGYNPVRRVFGVNEVEEHVFRNVSTFGIYLLKYDNTVNVSAIDIDIDTQAIVEAEEKEGIAGRERLFEIAKNEAKLQHDRIIQEYGIPCVIESSGRRGYHIWVFYRDSIPAMYAIKLLEKVVLKRHSEITSIEKRNSGSVYEIYPKQVTAATGKGFGNLLKLPLGKHRISKQFSHFINPRTMDKMDNQLDFLLDIEKNYRVKSNVIEQVLGEKIIYPEYSPDKNKGENKPGSGHLHSRFDVDVPDEESFKYTLNEMISLISPYRPENENGNVNRGNVDRCPPCVWKAYFNSKTLPSEFESRIVLLRYFANVARPDGRIGYTPNEIAGFFKYHINDATDNQHPEKLRYYISYYFGSIATPTPMFTCEYIQKAGFCINFNWKAVKNADLDEIIRIKKQWKDEEIKDFEIKKYVDKLNLVDKKYTEKYLAENGIKEFIDVSSFRWNSKIKDIKEQDLIRFQHHRAENPEKYSGYDVEAFIADLEKEIEQIRDEIHTQYQTIRKNYHIRCERIWSPFAANNEYEKLVQDTKNRIIEDSELPQSSDIVAVPKPVKKKEYYDDAEVDSYADSNDVLIDTEILDGKKESQSGLTDEFEQINKLTYDAITTMQKDKEPFINEVQKSTRVGATTSFTLSAKLHNTRVLILEPTNMIGIDTFSKTVKISEEKLRERAGQYQFNEPIYGGVFGSNITMCYKLYKKIYVDIIEELKKKGADTTHIAVYDLPFLFKESCMKEKKDGSVEYCPFYNCIHIGYPKMGENVTPVIQSQVLKEIECNWCKKKRHAVNPLDKCHYRTEFKFNEDAFCGKCPSGYYETKHKCIDQNSMPICGYATVYRHLIEDNVKIRVLRSSMPSQDEIVKNRNADILLLPASKIVDLINSGFIPNNSEYTIVGGGSGVGLKDESGQNIKEEIEIVQNIRLKPFDALVMTYTKVVALYQSIENLNRVGISGFSERIVNVIKEKAFDGIICDEVSRLVARSPMEFLLHAIGKQLDEYGNVSNDLRIINIFDDIEKEINSLVITGRNLNTNDDRRGEDRVDYFIALKDHFKTIFNNVSRWVINPVDIIETLSKTEYNQLIARKNKDQMSIFEAVISDISKNMPNIISDQLHEKLFELQDQGYLEGKVIDMRNGKRISSSNRPKMRFIDVYQKRAEMRKIAIQLRMYYRQRHVIDDGINDPVVKIVIYTDIQYSEYVNRYINIKDDITIQNDEIAIVNEILRPFDDHVSDIAGNYIGKFDGYKIGTFVIVGNAWMDIKILDDFIRTEEYRDGEGRLKSSDEVFLEMYSFLVRLAMNENVSFPKITQMLQITNVQSFFINSISTNEFKSKVVLQSVPSFDNIIDLTVGILGSKSRDTNSRFAITTDATMPLIEMSSVFGLPTRIWKFGDPKKTCDKQLVIADGKNINTSCLYSHKIVPSLISERQDMISDSGDYDDIYREIVAESVDSDYKKALQSYDDINTFHIIKKANGNIEYVDISKYLVRFHLFVFINMIAEKYSPSNVFLITPNRIFSNFLMNGMRKNGNGIPIEDIFIDWLKENYIKDFQMYLDKGWIKKDPTRSNESHESFSFHVTHIGGKKDGLDADNGDMDYYRGTRTIGTESKCRIMLAITSPTSPVNSYDWLARFYYEKNFMVNKTSRIGGLTIHELSRALRRAEIQSAAFQTFSRVKDPKSKNPSITFVWGVGSSDYQWGKCDGCGQSEIDLYNKKIDAYFDPVLKIQTDEIYETDMIGDNNTHLNLCYDCIKYKGANPISIAENRKINSCADPRGIEDLLAFKIPTPKCISVTPLSPSSKEVRHFLDSERRMIELADIFMNNKQMPSQDILRLKNKIISKTADVVLSHGMAVDKITAEDVKEFLTFTLSDLILWFSAVDEGKRVSKRMSRKWIERLIEDFGVNNMVDLNIVCNKDGEYRFHVKDMTEIAEIVEKSTKRKHLNNLAQISSS